MHSTGTMGSAIHSKSSPTGMLQMAYTLQHTGRSMSGVPPCYSHQGGT